MKSGEIFKTFHRARNLTGNLGGLKLKIPVIDAGSSYDRFLNTIISSLIGNHDKLVIPFSFMHLL